MRQHKKASQPGVERSQKIKPKPYERPSLIEWGSLRDLTRGLITGLEDLPMDGGTQNE